MSELKMAGMEYDDRIAELEKIEHPKPLRDFIYSTFNVFAEKHPWVGVENIRPKSVAREMFEGSYSFADYIREYELQRSEGILLRYLSETYKVLSQTVPEGLKTEAVEEMILYFRGLLQATDSSLVEEWERMQNPGSSVAPRSASEAAPAADAFSERKLRIEAKNAVFLVLRALARGDLASALELAPTPTLGPDFEAALLRCREESRIDVSPKARAPELLRFETGPETWRLEQTLSDAEGPMPWVLALELDVAASRERAQPVLRLLSLTAI